MVTQFWRAGVMGTLMFFVLLEVASIWHVFATAFVITVGEILVE